MKIGVALLRCGNCGKPCNPFAAHVCNGNRKSRTRLSPTVSLGNCPHCGKPRGNPLTHTCTIRTDFKASQRATERKAAAERKKAKAAEKRKAPARPARPAHDYRTCTDRDCRRYACLAWKEAFQEGRTTGLDDGWDIGYDAAASGRPRDHD